MHMAGHDAISKHSQSFVGNTIPDGINNNFSKYRDAEQGQPFHQRKSDEIRGICFKGFVLFRHAGGIDEAKLMKLFGIRRMPHASENKMLRRTHQKIRCARTGDKMRERRLHHYYDLVRNCVLHWYFRPYWCSACAFSLCLTAYSCLKLSSVHSTLLFRIKAQITFMPL